MNRKIKIIIGISSSVVLVLSTFLAIYFTVIAPPGLKEFDNIVIWNDSDFRNYKFEGKGTENEPYLITNLEISTTIAKGIFIADTTKHFIIDGCIIEAPYAGIYIQNTAANTVQISNNLIKNSKNGIFISNSDGIIVSNNSCENIAGENGISIYHSEGMTLYNNTCNSVSGTNARGVLENFGNGISITNCLDSIISSNTISNNEGNGISVLTSPNCTFEQNNINQNENNGMYIWDSGDSKIRYNEFVGPGLVFDAYEKYSQNMLQVIPLEYYRSFTVEFNYVNGKILGYYVDYINLTINTNLHDQYIFINCTNLSISDLEVTDSTGLIFYFCNNSHIESNTITYSAEFGIAVISSDNTTIELNTCNFNNWGGIAVVYTNNSLFKNNTLNHNLRNGLGNYQSHNNTIIENQCFFNQNVGLQVRWSTQIDIQRNNCSDNYIAGIWSNLSTDVIIFNNTLNRNLLYGFSGYSAISFYNISNNIISHNGVGIYLIGKLEFGFPDYCLISYNYISVSISHGIAIYGGSYNEIHHNSFINNNGGTNQALDSGSSNTWYDIISSEGSYWSDWISGPYTISGTASAQDLYPLVAPPV